MNCSQDQVAGKGSPHWLGKGRMRMYSSRLVGVIVMTSSTFWPLVTEVLTHKWAFNPVRVQLSYTQIDMNLPVSFSPSSFLSPAHPKTPASCCPTPPIGISPQSAASHAGLSLIWMRPGPVQLTCGLQQSSGLVFKMGLHCKDTHTHKKGEVIQNKRKLCWPKCVVWFQVCVAFNTRRSRQQSERHAMNFSSGTNIY